MNKKIKIGQLVKWLCKSPWAGKFECEGIVREIGKLNMGGLYGKTQPAVKVQVITKEYLLKMPRVNTWIAVKSLI